MLNILKEDYLKKEDFPVRSGSAAVEISKMILLGMLSLIINYNYAVGSERNFYKKELAKIQEFYENKPETDKGRRGFWESVDQRTYYLLASLWIRSQKGVEATAEDWQNAFQKIGITDYKGPMPPLEGAVDTSDLKRMVDMFRSKNPVQ